MSGSWDFLEAEVRRARAGLADLEAEHAALADPDVVALDDEHDSEGSTVGFERARVSGLIERTKRLLADLEAAHRRVSEGTYGRCKLCGAHVGRERLQALPTAQLCIRCATKSRRPGYRGPI